MALNLFTTGDTIDEESGEFTVVAGTPAGLCLKGASNDARVVVLKKDDADAFQPTSMQLTNASPDGMLVSPGTYKLRREGGTCGVFRD
ncbi:MAG TPA: hypothetical protein VGN60_09075 [Devosia sp.]|jgi:hypothetical protein|nr:hypothetical protein [Devosia sp.]